MLFIWFQRLLPARLLAWFIYRITRSRKSWLKNGLIRGFVRLYRVDTSEAALPVPEGYASFNAFFTRSLRAGARPLDPESRAILCPADGVIQQIGELNHDAILQVKGVSYSAADLLGGTDEAERFYGGSFVTIYLAPWNYHRVHSPLAGNVRTMTHIAGELWSVNATTARHVPGLFARNERLVCQCEGDAGAFAVVLVGALNVGSMSAAWCGEVVPRSPQSPARIAYPPDQAPRLDRGGELGQFNMGSTVVVLLPPGAARWHSTLAAGTAVSMGTAIGMLTDRRPQ